MTIRMQLVWIGLSFLISISAQVLNGAQHPSQIPISFPNTPFNQQPSQTSSFHPLLPPAIPLAVRSPYLSAWLATGSEGGNGGYLSGQWAQFWPIQFPSNPHAYRLGWAGLIRVDGLTYQFLGKPNVDQIGNHDLVANQTSFRYTSTRSIFEFEAGPCSFRVTFLSPLGPPQDLVRQSLPFSYLSIELIQSKATSIELYTDIQADWASGDHNANVTWSLNTTRTLAAYHLARQEPLVFSEAWEYAEWGEAIYSTALTPQLTTASGYAPSLRSQFVIHGQLNDQQDNDYRAINDRTPAFAYAAPLTLSQKPLVFVIGHIRDPYVSYVRAGEQEHRSGYWRSQFATTTEALEFSVADYEHAADQSDKLDHQIEADALKTSGPDHAAIVSLSARQGLGALEITIGKGQDGHFNHSDIKAFSKEISSNGDMSTVDVIFPQFPILTYYDPKLLKYLLEPLFEYSESGLYPNQWTVHDLGRYPNATGHNDGADEPMPVEEAGNMLIMALAYHQLTKDTAWLSQHYKILSQWSTFLVSDGLIPAKQLSTDDFAGTLANQTDLAIKAIIGIGAMAEIAKVTGHVEHGAVFRNISEDYVGKWIGYSISPDRTHTKLAYQDEHSWGTLYNLFADRLLNLRLVPHMIYQMQSTFYPLVANEYGVPLDSRHTWAKTDWQMFAAGAATSAEGRDLFVDRLVKFLKANIVNAAFPDLYETETAQFPGRSNTSTWRIEFINRPVTGGHFSLLALDKANQANGVHENFFPKQSSASRNQLGWWTSLNRLFEFFLHVLAN